MTNSTPHLYVRKGLESGRDPGTVVRARRAYLELEARGVTPILTLGHLAQLTGARYEYLRSIVERRHDGYLDITRRKRDGGGTRSISAPEPVLMDVQRWILRNVLVNAEVHPYSYAYRKGQSIVDCASRHIGARWLVKFDLHDFFDSIDERRVFRIFQAMGYSRLVSFELARISTRPQLPNERRDPKHAIRRYQSEQIGVLPQGGPTSGALANAATVKLDGKLASLATRHGLVYTRYSDDITFSGGPQFSRAAASRLISHVDNLVRDNSLELHRRKTRVIPPGARHVVLGLMLADDRLRLLPEARRQIELHIRGVAKFGLPEHARDRKFSSMLSLLNHVDGRIAFAHSVEPDYAAIARAEWSQALALSGYPQPS